MNLDALTHASIQIQGVEAHVGRTVAYRCGCHYATWDATWRLCAYHQGYDEGIEALRAAQVAP